MRFGFAQAIMRTELALGIDNDDESDDAPQDFVFVQWGVVDAPWEALALES